MQISKVIVNLHMNHKICHAEEQLCTKGAPDWSRLVVCFRVSIKFPFVCEDFVTKTTFIRWRFIRFQMSQKLTFEIKVITANCTSVRPLLVVNSQVLNKILLHTKFFFHILCTRTAWLHRGYETLCAFQVRQQIWKFYRTWSSYK